MMLTEVIRERGVAVTAEVAPPKGVDVGDIVAEAAEVARLVDAVNVTDGQGANMHMGPLAVARLLVEAGVEPVLQLTCRDRNRIALQADLLGAYALGIRNVLALTGDHVMLGDHPGAKPVFGLDSVQLLQVARELEAGRDMTGNALQGAPELCVGAVVAPEADNVELQLIKMHKKIDAGARFFQTQAVFDPPRFARFMERVAPLDVPVLAGIIPVRSPRMARIMNARVPGVTVPPWIIHRLNEAEMEDRAGVACEIAGQIAQAVIEHCQGLHVMAQGWDEALRTVVKMAGIQRSDEPGDQATR